MSKTRRQIAERVSLECSINMRESKAILDAILRQMSDALARGEDVKLANFGSFSVHQTPARTGRNPKTGEPADISERTRLRFKPSKTLLARMKETTPLSGALTADAFSSGVIASTLTPFSETGAIQTDAITDQAHRLAQIDGILGIAVNTTIRERQSVSQTERIEIIKRTREALNPDQLLLACVGALTDDVADEIAACAEAGANAVITFPPSWREGPSAPALNDHLAQLRDAADSLPLPIIAAIGEGHRQSNGTCPEIAGLARTSRKVIGIDMGTHDNVLHYDQAYYALKTIDRPLACLPSSEAALFHNLNTGADGVISCLAYVAPHEVSALYRATKAGLTHEAQALHNKLAPLIGLISGRDKTTREMVLRQIAHSRALLASTDARGLSDTLDACTIHTIEQTLDEIALTPIEWW